MHNRYDLMDVNNKIIWNFREIGHTMRHTSEGKGSQKRILIILDNAGAITQRELTQRLGIKPGSASEVIGKLEAAGLLNRKPSDSDRRTTDVYLTEEGKKAAQEARTHREELYKQMFSCFSEDEKDGLLSLLEELNSSWGKNHLLNHVEKEAECFCGCEENTEG